MECVQYIIIGILLILFINIFIYLIKIYNQRKKYKEEYIQKKKSEYEKELADTKRAIETANHNRKIVEKNFNDWREQEIRHIQEREEASKKYIESLEEKKQAYERSQNEQEQLAKNNLYLVLENYYKSNREEYEQTLRDMQETLQQDAQEEWQKYLDQHQEELDELIAKIEEYKERQNAINEQILRQRAIDEEQDFYRICITDDDLADIDLLLNIKKQLHKSQLLDKIIYDTFVSKYVKEMAKRVLAGKDPTGIYKVTNTKTQEIYIGKSTTIASRWQNHCKSAFGLEGVADSQFQRALKKYGVQSFTWELLEETPKDKLTEREKYYIQFYETTKYGYNQKIG